MFTGKRETPYKLASLVYGNASDSGEFSKKFIISPDIIINEIGFEEGTLHIALERQFPQENREGLYPTLFKNGVIPKLT